MINKLNKKKKQNFTSKITLLPSPQKTKKKKS